MEQENFFAAGAVPYATMISVIIPTYNAAKHLEALLESLRQQTVGSEIMVVDSTSTDGTPELAQRHGAAVMTVSKEAFDHGGVRTLAGKAARGELLVYLTQDALPVSATALEKLLEPLADRTVAAVYGRQLPRPGASLFGAHLRLFNYPEGSWTRSLGDRQRYGIRTPFLSNSFAAYRKACLQEIGWFSERLIMGEDTAAGARLLRLGYRLAYTAEAAVYHSHDYTLRQDFRRSFDIGVFHQSEDRLLAEFGGAGKEGLAYLRSAVRYLAEHRALPRLPELLLRTSLRFTGYTLGRRFRRLPLTVVRSCSMHRDWWREGTAESQGPAE